MKDFSNSKEFELLKKEWFKFLFLAENIDLLKSALDLEKDGYVLKNPLYEKIFANCYRLSVIDLGSLREYMCDPKHSFFFSHLKDNIEFTKEILNESLYPGDPDFFEAYNSEKRKNTFEKYLGRPITPSELKSYDIDKIKKTFIKVLTSKKHPSTNSPTSYRNQEAHIFTEGWDTTATKLNVHEVISDFEDLVDRLNDLSSMLFANAFVVKSTLSISVKEDIKFMFKKNRKKRVKK